MLQVDAGTGTTPVDSAMAAWNASPSSAALANDAVREIGHVIDTYRNTHRTVTNIVLVGADAALPFARLDDCHYGCERDRATRRRFRPIRRSQPRSAAGKVLSDDPYGDDNPQPFLNRQLYVPDVALGRLVETPTDIEGAVQRFVTFDGELDKTTALTTGYSFLTDSATEIAASLNGVASVDTVLNNETWTKSDLTNAFLAGPGGPTSLTSLNGHASHDAFGPPAGRELFRVADLAAANFARKLVFSVGCHSGLSVTDVVVPGLSNSTDWAQSYQQRGATYLGNTGFGYGDTDVSAYSEEIARIFAANLVDGTMTAGEAMLYAKQEHFGNLGLVSVYDEKSSAEMTMYGLPMWKVPGAAGPAAQSAGSMKVLSSARKESVVAAAPTVLGSTATLATAAAPTVPDPVTGLPSEAFLHSGDTDPTFTPVVTARGTYLRGDDGVQVTHFRPIQPKKVVQLDATDVHGAVIEALTSRDQANVDPVFARPLVDDPAHEPELPYDDLAFPSKIQTVTTVLTPDGPKKRLVLVTGQFFGDGVLDEDGEGIQRRFEHIAGRAYVSTSNDFAAATFEKIEAVKTTGLVTFSIDLSEGSNTVKRVLVGYLEDTGATGARVWTFVDLVPDGPNSKRWVKSVATCREPRSVLRPVGRRARQRRRHHQQGALLCRCAAARQPAAPR